MIIGKSYRQKCRSHFVCSVWYYAAQLRTKDLTPVSDTYPILICIQFTYDAYHTQQVACHNIQIKNWRDTGWRICKTMWIQPVPATENHKGNLNMVQQTQVGSVAYIATGRGKLFSPPWRTSHELKSFRSISNSKSSFWQFNLEEAISQLSWLKSSWVGLVGWSLFGSFPGFGSSGFRSFLVLNLSRVRSGQILGCPVLDWVKVGLRPVCFELGHFRSQLSQVLIRTSSDHLEFGSLLRFQVIQMQDKLSSGIRLQAFSGSPAFISNKVCSPNHSHHSKFAPLFLSFISNKVCYGIQKPRDTWMYVHISPLQWAHPPAIQELCWRPQKNSGSRFLLAQGATCQYDHSMRATSTWLGSPVPLVGTRLSPSSCSRLVLCLISPIHSGSWRTPSGFLSDFEVASAALLPCCGAEMSAYSVPQWFL